VRFGVGGRSVVGIGLLSLGIPLGSTDRREVALAVARLIALKANLLDRPGRDSGDAPVTVCWSPQALRVARAAPGRSLSFVLPADGFEIAHRRPVRGAHDVEPLAAYAFLDFCLPARCAAPVAERLGTQSGRA